MGVSVVMRRAIVALAAAASCYHDVSESVAIDAGRDGPDADRPDAGSGCFAQAFLGTDPHADGWTIHQTNPDDVTLANGMLTVLDDPGEQGTISSATSTPLSIASMSIEIARFPIDPESTLAVAVHDPGAGTSIALASRGGAMTVNGSDMAVGVGSAMPYWGFIFVGQTVQALVGSDATSLNSVATTFPFTTTMPEIVLSLTEGSGGSEAIAALSELVVSCN